MPSGRCRMRGRYQSWRAEGKSECLEVWEVFCMDQGPHRIRESRSSQIVSMGSRSGSRATKITSSKTSVSSLRRPNLHGSPPLNRGLFLYQMAFRTLAPAVLSTKLLSAVGPSSSLPGSWFLQNRGLIEERDPKLVELHGRIFLAFFARYVPGAVSRD